MDWSTELRDTAEPEQNHGFDYDLVVVGGGSGGLALAKEAAKVAEQNGSNLKVAVLDFVKPSPAGTKWGLGGTCVNVGCIPKKLMHQAALLGEGIKDAKEFGWKVPEEKLSHDWETLVNAVQDHIGSLNWGYRVALRDKKIEYLNALGVFVDPHTIECTNKANKVWRVTSRRFVLAVGGRPRIPEFPGKEHCITSDDVFSLEHPPGKTLVVGGSYVALECAGFLSGVGFDTTVLTRSIFLRGFDQEMANKVAEYMANHGVKFVRPAVPTKVEKVDGKLKVHWIDSNTKQEQSETYDTVLVATGRRADTDHLGLDKVGVQVDPSDGKIPVMNERTNIPHVYALGDVIKGDLELTPVAIKAGRLLARRLYGNSTALMDYHLVATTVFTPLEYSSVGYTEDAAKENLGEDNIEVYHSYYQPLEWTVSHREENACYCKVICDTKRDNLVVGMHLLGPHTGDIIQGFATAMKLGLTKQSLDDTVGIHPTIAEEILDLNISKRSGEDPKKKGC